MPPPCRAAHLASQRNRRPSRVSPGHRLRPSRGWSCPRAARLASRAASHPFLHSPASPCPASSAVRRGGGGGRGWRWACRRARPGSSGPGRPSKRGLGRLGRTGREHRASHEAAAPVVPGVRAGPQPAADREGALVEPHPHRGVQCAAVAHECDQVVPAARRDRPGRARTAGGGVEAHERAAQLEAGRRVRRHGGLAAAIGDAPLREHQAARGGEGADEVKRRLAPPAVEGSAHRLGPPTRPGAAPRSPPPPVANARRVQARRPRSNSPGPIGIGTRRNASCEAMPLGDSRNRPSQARFVRPQSAMSSELSAWAGTAHTAIASPSTSRRSASVGARGPASPRHSSSSCGVTSSGPVPPEIVELPRSPRRPPRSLIRQPWSGTPERTADNRPGEVAGAGFAVHPRRGGGRRPRAAGGPPGGGRRARRRQARPAGARRDGRRGHGAGALGPGRAGRLPRLGRRGPHLVHRQAHHGGDRRRGRARARPPRGAGAGRPRPGPGGGQADRTTPQPHPRSARRGRPPTPPARAPRPRPAPSAPRAGP